MVFAAVGSAFVGVAPSSWWPNVRILASFGVYGGLVLLTIWYFCCAKRGEMEISEKEMEKDAFYNDDDDRQNMDDDENTQSDHGRKSDDVDDDDDDYNVKTTSSGTKLQPGSRKSLKKKKSFLSKVVPEIESISPDSMIRTNVCEDPNSILNRQGTSLVDSKWFQEEKARGSHSFETTNFKTDSALCIIVAISLCPNIRLFYSMFEALFSSLSR